MEFGENMLSDEVIWEVKGEVAGREWEPHGLFSSQEHQSLLVCDYCRLVVLNPTDGSVLQVIPLPNMGILISLSVHEGNIILHNETASGECINVLNIK